MYGEDVNYTQRLKYHGYKVGITPLSKIYHRSENNYYKNEIFGSKKFISKFINNYYVSYADVNVKGNLGHVFYALYILRKSFLNFFKLNISKAFIYFRLFRFLDLKLVQDTKSRAKEIGPQYLSIDN